MKVGDRVRITDFPTRYMWMEEFISEVGVVAEINDKHTAYGVKGLLPDGDLAWFIPRHLEPARAAARKSA